MPQNNTLSLTGDSQDDSNDGVFTLRDPSDYLKWSARIKDALKGKRMYSFIDGTELPPSRPNFTTKPLTIQ